MSFQGPIPHETLRQIYSMVAPAAVTIVNTGSECAAQVFVFDVRESGEAEFITSLPPHTVNALHATDRAKQGLSTLIREILEGGEADVIAYVTESWTTQIGAQEVDAGLARYNELRAAGVTLEHQPGRGEALVVALHTREGTCASMMPITGQPRCVTFAPVDLAQIGSPEFTGRMSMNKVGAMS